MWDGGEVSLRPSNVGATLRKVGLRKTAGRGAVDGLEAEQGEWPGTQPGVT